MLRGHFEAMDELGLGVSLQFPGPLSILVRGSIASVRSSSGAMELPVRMGNHRPIATSHRPTDLVQLGLYD